LLFEAAGNPVLTIEALFRNWKRFFMICHVSAFVRGLTHPINGDFRGFAGKLKSHFMMCFVLDGRRGVT
jgi:hypothetical protein